MDWNNRIKNTKAYPRDTRLPTGIETWLQLAETLMKDNPSLLFKELDEEFYMTQNTSMFEAHRTQNPNASGHELFTCDLFTLKLRVFDEIFRNAIGKDKKREIYETIWARLNHTDQETMDALQFIFRLI